jgi:MFS family permease
VVRVVAFAATRDLIPLYGVYALLFVDHGLSTGAVSSLFVIWSITGFVFEVPSGAWADTYDRRRLLVSSAALWALALTLWTVWPAYPGFALGFALWGLSGAMVSGTFEALVYDELAARGATVAYPKLLGWARSAENAAATVGILVAAPLFAWGGYPLVGWASVAMAVLHGAAAWSMPARRTPDGDEGEGRDDCALGALGASRAECGAEYAAADDDGGEHADDGARGESFAARQVGVHCDRNDDGDHTDVAEDRRVEPDMHDRDPVDGDRGVEPPAGDDDDDDATTSSRYLALLREGVGEATRHPVARRAVLITALLLGLTTYDEYLPLVADESGASTTLVPVLVAVVAVGQLIGTALAGRTAHLPRRGIATIVAAGAALLVFGSLSGHPVGGFVVLAAAFGLAHNAVIASEARLQDSITGRARATVTSVSSLATEVVVLAVYAGVAIGSSWLSVSVLVAACAVPTLGVAWATARWLPDRAPGRRGGNAGAIWARSVSDSERGTSQIVR